MDVQTKLLSSIMSVRYASIQQSLHGCLVSPYYLLILSASLLYSVSKFLIDRSAVSTMKFLVFE